MTTAETILIILSSVLIILLALLLIFFTRLKKSTNNIDPENIKSLIKEANDEEERRLLDDNARLRDSVQQTQSEANKNLSDFKVNITESLNTKFGEINKALFESLNKNNNEINARSADNYAKTIKELSDFKDKTNSSIDTKFQEISKTLNDGLLKIGETMNLSVKENFDKTNQTFVDIQKNMAVINEAQKNLQDVETSITSFKDILTNNKTRGNFGEFQLNNIIKDIFGEKNNIYKIQAALSPKVTVDVLLNLPSPLGQIAIDSKFPFQNYQRIYDPELAQSEKDAARKQFKIDVKKHIDDIADKYIIKGITTDQAIMFVPSEAIFAEIQANCPDALEESRKRRVWITSPTTLMFLLQTVEITLKDQERNKNATIILEALRKLSDEFNRYAKRWDNFDKHLGMMVQDAGEIKTTTEKISNRFNQINTNSASIKLNNEEDETKEIKENSDEEIIQ